MNPPYDTVIALGKNWKHPLTDPIELSIESCITTLAAAILFKQGTVKSILFSTGKTAGKHYPSEAEAMYAYMRKYFSKDVIPDNACILETTSFDTLGNAVEVKKLLKEHTLQSTVLLTIGYHLPRSVHTFTSQGIPPSIALASEEVLQSFPLTEPPLPLASYFHSFRYKKEVGKEWIARLLTVTIDPTGERILRKLTTKTRHQ